MALDEETRAATEKRKIWATKKRETLIALFRAVHALAARVDSEPEVIPELLVKVDGLEALWAQFEIEDNVILDCLITLDKVQEYAVDLIPEVRSLYDQAVAIALAARESTGRPASSNLNSTNTSDSSMCNRPVFRLPEIPLPRFNGEFKNWATFQDRFTALVDSRPNLSKTDKMYYLIGCLHGAAADAIKGIPAAADNYDLIWSTLSSRFHRPRLLATSLIDKLIDAPVASQETLSDLNNFAQTFEESIALLKSLNIDDLASFILFSLAFRCLAPMTRKLFESSTTSVYPSVKDLIGFVHTRISILENVGEPRKTSLVKSHSKFGNTQATSQSARVPQRKYPLSSLAVENPVNNSNKCICCNGSHNLSSCPQFRVAWSTDERTRFSRDHRLCFKCLSAKHWANKCTSKGRCSTCSKGHHTLLHPGDSQNLSQATSSNTASLCASASTSLTQQPATVLLGTALIHIRDRLGTWQVVRALVDSASQISAITSSCCDRLGLHREPWSSPVCGLSATPVVHVSGLVTCEVRPRFAMEPVLSVQACVLPSITGDMPRQSLSVSVKDQYSTLALADPNFYQSSTVDMLLGAELYGEIMDGRRVSVNRSLPTAFSSIFGWILIGPTESSAQHPLSSIPVSLTVSIEELMERFWRIEEPDVAPSTFTEGGKCEETFKNEHQRLSSGRFMVPLPMRVPISKMSYPRSRDMADHRFKSLERKLTANPKLRTLYIEFMNEYISLGHMSVAESPGKYIIPHHAVYRPDDGDDKIRVVFDASARCARSHSLYQCLYQGPKLQQDLVDILIRFRVHKYALTADICKMYRQILVSPEHRTLQHILWRPSPNDDLVEYELNTVTYGLTCAPFLAIRVLQAIVETDCVGYDDVRDALLRQTYVDDICVGADSVQELTIIQRHLIDILGKSGLELKKWLSNTDEVLNAVPIADRQNTPMPFNDDEGIGTKVLGLLWHSMGDYFACALRLESSPKFTKRGVLSVIARIFDSLGLFAPTVFFAKCIMQRTWQSKLAWDDPLPPDIHNDWSKFMSELVALSSLRIPRYLNTAKGTTCALLGFCDASTRGYAAVVYIRVLNAPCEESVVLVGTKTKLAPLKPQTVPRLELNATVLLTRWLQRVKAILDPQLTIVDVYAWSDSSTVLSWLTTPHSTFKVYVSKSYPFRAVFTTGMSMVVYFVRDENFNWDATAFPLVPVDELPELRQTSLVTQSGDGDTEWFSKFSSYDGLICVVAQVLRFINRCRGRATDFLSSSLSRIELVAAEHCVVRESQRIMFPSLRHELSRDNGHISKPLARLHPFVDDQNIVRVGGRLRHSNLFYGTRHPILLHKRSLLATLLVRRWHKITCHSGPRLLTAMISRHYWIISIRSVIHKVISQCVICTKLAARSAQPIMADLPAERVQQCPPFSRVGVNFAGPLQMRENSLRKARLYKTYLAIFVCFSTKATHLEVVSDLPTAAFLAAFDRFVARRGLPTDIFSDCGTNFIGTDKQLQKLLVSPVGQAALGDARPMCNWHFNPPSAPHFGGLWEAAVRSTKRLLVRVMGTHVLSYEELTTVITRIEAVLNSRPITPLSNDPHYLEALTPGHFLIGQPLLAVPPTVQEDAKMSFTNRWKMLNQCHQAFWRRWSAEYLTTLQARPKWTKNAPNLKVGDMVVIRDNLTTPLKWPLGRIVMIHPGADGVVRVARVLTQQGEYTRPVVKLVLLVTQ